jgi:DNA mismatch repair protein MutS2
VAAATAEAQAAREATLRLEEKEATRERARQAKAYLLEARKRVEAALSLAQGAGHEASAREARRLVEEGIRSEAATLDEPEALRPVDPSARLVVGARVRLTTGATGEVAELRGDGRAVVLVGAMRLVVKAATLEVLRDQAAPRVAPLPRGDDPVRSAATEIDLRGMRVDEATPVVLAALDAAVLAEEPELRVIHGMGTGALREAIRAMLQRDSRVASIDFALRQQGGTGVTVAVLR